MRTKTNRFIWGSWCVFGMERPDVVVDYSMIRVSGFAEVIDLVHIRLSEFLFNGIYILLIEVLLHDMDDNDQVAGAIRILVSNVFPMGKSSDVVVIGSIRSPVHDTDFRKICCGVWCLGGKLISWCRHGVINRDFVLVNIRKEVVFGVSTVFDL